MKEIVRIITANSSKVSTPSPLMSKVRIIALQSSRECEPPSLDNMFLKLAGVMQPDPPISYISNASLSSFFFSS
ncbi:hypothetical protein F8388_011187 [Cannabis sativa]|uniref:Uncharacterized protein n=1 Tax=Cannabis sativa TaxID=3483 RepID=A0A7J6ESE1_CANSA|nr:hypothetical protein F8388_011187 [Cannabis sativa]